MSVEANASEVAAAGLDILATVGAYLEDPAALADVVLPALPVEAIYVGAVTALAAFVKYTQAQAADLVEVGAFFAVSNMPTTMEETSE